MVNGIDVCVLEYDDQYVDMDANGVPRTQEAKVTNKCVRGILILL